MAAWPCASGSSCTATRIVHATSSITSTWTARGHCATTSRSSPVTPREEQAVTRVAVIGTGLVGGSVGMALRRAGIEVRGYDRDAGRAMQAKELGAVDEVAGSLSEAVAGADAAVVAVPVGDVAGLVVEALDAGVPAVTDAGSVKAPVVAAVEEARPDLAPRFVGGHPMAGSEQDGLDGADADLFVGAT